MQVVRRRHGPRRWPLLLLAPAPAVVELAELSLAPGAAAHDEDLDRRLVGRLSRSIVRKPAVEERELLLEVVPHAPARGLAEIDVERERRVAAHADVAPRADDQPLRRRVLSRHRREVLGVGVGEAVVPAGRHRRRDVGVLVPEAREVVLLLRPPLVVGPARAVVLERLVERRDLPQRELALVPRPLPEELPQVAEVVPHLLLPDRVALHLLRVGGVDVERPEHVQLHRAALARLVVVRVRRRDVGPDRGQVRRTLERRPDLRDAGVRAADHSGAAVAPRPGRDPLDRVVAVLAGVRRRAVEVLLRPLRTVPVAQVLQHDRVAVRHEEVGDLRVAALRLVVWRQAHDRREAAVDEVALAGRAVDVGREQDAVPHLDHHVLAHRDPVAHAPSLSMIRLP